MKAKTYTDGRAHVPPRIADVIEPDNVHPQFTVYVTAPTKKAADERLTARGVRTARDDFRLTSGSETGYKALAAVGLLGPGGPASTVLVYKMEQRDRAIARVAEDGTATVVAYWRYDHRRGGLYVERA